MTAQFTLSEQNMVEVMLVQALCGAITPNFRRITLLPQRPEVRVEFVLEVESAEDREEIEDIITDFDVYLMDVGTSGFALKWGTTVDSGALTPVDAPTRVVYRRKEPVPLTDSSAQQ